MATPAQIHANRLNSQKSTGPRSARGKDAVRFNALKHGADAESRVIPGEDAVALDSLSRSYFDQIQPAGPLEVFLVETMVRADWLQRRLSLIETDLLNSLLRHGEDESEQASLGLVFQRDAAGSNSLQKIFRRQQAAQRDWYRALSELRRLQRERFRSLAEAEDIEEDAGVAGALGVASIGFVPPPYASVSAPFPNVPESAAALPERNARTMGRSSRLGCAEAGFSPRPSGLL